MASENEKFESVTPESSYGGSTYRLSYDLKENKKSRNRSHGTKAIVAVIVSIILLFVFSYLALRHYDDAIKKLYASETNSDDESASADFESSVVIK